MQQYSFRTNDCDLGLFSNLLWNLANGNGYYLSQYDINFLTHHFTPASALFSPAFILFDTNYTLPVIHAMAVASVFFILPHIIKELCPEASPVTLRFLIMATLLLAITYKPLMAAWRYQTHMTTLSLPFLLLAILSLHKKSNMTLLLCTLVLATSQERASVALFSLGIYAMLVVKRHKLGILLCSISTVYFFMVVKLVIPTFNGGEYDMANRLDLTANLTGKSHYIYKLFMFLGFLPILGWRVTAAALPLVALNLMSKESVMYTMNLHYDDLQSVFFILGASVGLNFCTQLFHNKPFGKGILASITICILINNAYYGRNTLPLTVITKALPTPQVSRLHYEMKQLDSLPQKAMIFAQTGLGPHVCNRYNCRQLTQHSLQNESVIPSGSYILLSPIVDNFRLGPYKKAILKMKNIAIPIYQGNVFKIFRKK